jgi:CRISPR type III-A-associated RAMP protein Csm4
MTKFSTYQLFFQGALHLSDVREDYGKSEEQIHSDTLQAAMIAALSAVGAAPPESGLPFAVSSLFPFYTDEHGNVHYFFPKPFLRFQTEKEISEVAKKIKKVKWLDQHYFQKIIKGEDFGDFTADLQDKYLHQKKIESPISFSQTVPRVRVPRDYDHPDKDDSETKIFYMQMLRFREKAGFYFLASADEVGHKTIHHALTILSDEGFGTDRNVGNGHFEFDKGEINLEIDDSSEYMTNLSLFCPESSEQLDSMLKGNGGYELKKRGGWITSPNDLGKRKRAVYMMSEGSVFSRAVPPNQQGVIVAGAAAIDFKPADITLNVKGITRSGKAIFLPVKTS